MPRPCTICHHPQREAIDQALVAGEAFRNIAQRFAASPDAVYRHKQDHLPQALVQAKKAYEVSQADTLLDQLQAITADTRTILRAALAEATQDHELALKAIARLEKQLELQGRLLGELRAAEHAPPDIHFHIHTARERLGERLAHLAQRHAEDATNGH